MLLKNSININALKNVLNTTCRLIQSQVETRPHPVNDLEIINSEERRVDTNDVKPELSSVFDGEKSLNADVSNIAIPKNFFNIKKDHKRIKYSFAIDDNVAKKIVDCIRPYILEDKSVIIEANPGVGLITRHLLAAGVEELQICQKQKLLSNFNNLVTSNHPRINVHLRDAFKEWKYEEHDSIAFINCIHKNVTERHKNSQDENPKLKIISVEYNGTLLPAICRQILHGKWFYYDDVEYYFIFGEHVLRNFLGDTVKKQRNKHWLHSVFHLLMNCEKLCELPRISFLPWAKTDKKPLYLMRISKKPNAFNIIKREELRDFYNFLQVIGTSKYNYIIPTLEHWSPGCGAYLIKGGIPMWKQVVDLSSEEAAHLYKLFQSTPEFDNYKEVLNGGVLELVVEENDEKVSESSERLCSM